ncbi:MAG: ATP-binding cassette domain-containing protein [Holophaga sp.]|nr:ATP-binding cassette domain-containing protein [Holophaga sp.]
MYIQSDIAMQRPGLPPLQAAFQLNLKHGRMNFLVGPPGSGKSALLRILLGRQRPDRGLIAADGRIWFHRNGEGLIETLDRPVTGAFHEDILSRHQTVLAVLARALPDWPPQARARRVAELLVRFGMKRLAKRRVMDLDLEQCWLLVLARAFAPRPKLLLLDEPFLNLAPEQIQRLEAELRAMVRAEGVSVLVSDAGNRPLGRPGDLILPMAMGQVLRVFPVPTSVVA